MGKSGHKPIWQHTGKKFHFGVMKTYGRKDKPDLYYNRPEYFLLAHHVVGLPILLEFAYYKQR